MPIETARAIHAQRLQELRPMLADLLRDKTHVVLEIGCGHGHFLTDYAEAHSSHFCVGVDLLMDRLVRARKKSDRLGLSNIAWVRAEAALFLEALPDPVRFSRVMVLFPDPWPKRRHWKNRLIQTAFLSQLADRVGHGGELCFRTDYAPYFDWTKAVMQHHPCWEISDTCSWPFERATVFQTRADHKYNSLIAKRNQMTSPRDLQPCVPECSSSEVDLA